jgi:RHS repeat-associated protein
MIMFSPMQRFIFFLSLFLSSCLRIGYAQDFSHLSIPTPFIQGVNVISGKADESVLSQIHYELYREGWNASADESLFLAKGDFRIGKVKTIRQELPEQPPMTIHLSYEPGATQVYDTPERMIIYRYTDNQLLNAVEHYQREPSGHLQFYRCERLFWEDAKPAPHLISRVLEDEKGQAVLCYCFFYDNKGQLIREMLVGNLSGNCQIPCQIGPNGYPQINGVESYSTRYTYSKKDPDLLLSQIEDNGLITTYQYDSPTKQCTGKLRGHLGGLISRCFYIYDNEGFLEQTIVDDGQGQRFDDLTGVTQRHIIRSQLGHQLPLLGQPIKTESFYWDPFAQQEKGLESISYFYSDQGQLVEQDFHDADGNLRYDLRFNYDEQGKLNSTVDSRGEVVLKDESSQQERYNEWGQRIATLDAYGNETIYAYDPFGRLISIQAPAVLDLWDQAYHPITKHIYNICDQVTQIIDPKGEKSLISYNIRGKPIKIVYPDGSYESFSYFLDGALKEKRMCDGTTFSFTRDEACRVIRSEKYSPTGNTLQILCYTYQGDLVETVTDEQTFITHFLYDGVGRQIGSIQKTKDGTRRLEYGYDACGQKSQVREWFGPSAEDFVVKVEQKDKWQSPKATIFEDASGQQKYKVDHVDSAPSSDFVFKQTSATLNSLGQYVKREERVDGYGIRHILTYDALERLETLVKYNAMGAKLGETHFRYDAQGNKVLEKHDVFIEGRSSRIFSIRWDYDPCKRLLSIVEGERDQSKTTRYHYNSYGQLDQVIKPDGTLLFYSYSADGQLDRFEASDHSFAYHYCYDHLQRLVAIHDLCHDLVQRRHYNAFHELVEDQQGLGIEVRHHYDLAGRRTGLTLPDHSGIVYHYEGPLLAAVEHLGADEKSHYKHAYIYDANGRLQTCQLLGAIGSIDYQYNNQGRLVAIASPWWSQKIDQDGFDPYGRLLATTVQDNCGEQSSHFTYNDNGQLATEEGHAYTYDSLFNRLSDNGQSWKINALNQLVQTSEISYLYDTNGNLIEKQAENERVFYCYDALDRLIRVEYPEKKALTYVYDAFHRRIEQRAWVWEGEQHKWDLQSSERLVYDGFKEIGKVNDQEQLVELRILGHGQGAEMGAAIALELKNKIFIPLHDSFGSVRCLIDAEKGEVVESYRYSAYGEESLWNEKGQSIDHSLVGNPWRFCCKRVDDWTGLVFFGKRDYDPLMGRWLTPDPLFFYDNPNLYAFAKNDPLNRYDLYGLFSISQIWDSAVNTFFACFNYLQISAHHAKIKLNAELKLPPPLGRALEKIGKTLFGESTYLLMGPHFEETHVDCYGQREISDKVRVTFINGILSTRNMMLQNLKIISESHGGVKVHYVYRPTEGWTWDISRAAVIRTAFTLGFRSTHANLLAQLWRNLIQEMGGLEGGGTILHYAHSLGGSETDRARELLSLEEQNMIRVVTFGSATFVRNIGFQSVVNYVSVNDGVSSIFLEPLGHIRNYFDPDSNVRFHGSFLGSPYWPTDHLLTGPTYGPILRQLGEQFLAEFSPV